MEKKAQILVSNLVFIILNLIFLTILVLYITKQGNGAINLEQSSAKQIALILDSAKPGMIIKLNMEKAEKLSEKNGFDFDKVVVINKNLVKVKLSEKGGAEYSFFNDVQVNSYPDKDGIYIFVINEKDENKNEKI